jgi:hypothetical protein
MNTTAESRTSIPTLIVVAATMAGAVLGIFEIANTSVGWHLASGRWILENGSFLRSDPFSFTSSGAAWIDHEWIFQIVVAVVDRLGGGTGLVALRAIVVAGLALLLLHVSVRSGMSPAAALLLALFSVAGARSRFFLRPELATLVIVPAVVWLFLRRERAHSNLWFVPLAILMIIGGNAHGGVLVLPLLLAGILAAEVGQMVLARQRRPGAVITGVAGVAAATMALLVNPYGWHLFSVPFHLSRLVDQAHIPNPEWISPSLTQAPVLYLTIAGATIVLALRERRAGRWVLLIMASALAVKHIRNTGLFFVLLPLTVAPALASWRALSPSTELSGSRRRRTHILAVAAAAVLAASMALSPWPRFGFGFADDYYPDRACEFLDREDLPKTRLYNDVRFGGYLIDRYFPPRQVFQDDRNEIHDLLLQEIWRILQTSDVHAWSNLLAGFEVDTALVRYHSPIRVATPDGSKIGDRGFTALWFPLSEWALVYWDDVAMILVRREHASVALLDRHEYRIIRPDDLAHLEHRLREDPRLRPAAEAEARRALAANPASERALHIFTALTGSR